MAMLFCLVGWMEKYQGLEEDSIQGGGSYIDENGTGSEIHGSKGTFILLPQRNFRLNNHFLVQEP